MIAIDPGPKESAFVDWDGERVIDFGKWENDRLLYDTRLFLTDKTVIEMVASYGMAVGKDVFETVFWIGRFYQVAGVKAKRIYRKDVKMHLCGNTRANDSNIITALVDRFDPERVYGKYGKGIKKNPGPFFGFSKDIWQAFALAVTYWDKHHKQTKDIRSIKFKA